MARTDITPIDMGGPYATAGTDVTFTAGDATNGNQFTATGREMILVRNTDTSSHTLTVVAADDPYGRSENLSESLAATGNAGDHTATAVLPRIGWTQSDGKVYIDVSSGTLEIAVLRFTTG